MNWNRRKFVKTTSAIAGASSCGLISLVGCTPIKYVSGEVKNNAMVVDKSQWGDAEFVLVKNPKLPAPIFLKHSGQGYSALLLECTHKQCEVRPNSRSLKCPCHGSEYDHVGKVLEGPAEKDLKSFKVWEDDKTIYIQ
jgi:cytochrome b6-f complex iron-sulfur subunit